MTKIVQQVSSGNNSEIDPNSIKYYKQLDRIKKLALDTNVPEDFHIKWLQAKTIIGVQDNLIEDTVHILKSFLVKYVDEEEQQKLIDLKNARNLLIETNLLTQIHTTGQFEKWKKPFSNTCQKCKGAGELLLFNRITKDVTCNKCKHGIVWLPCPKCDGTGRVIVRYKKGGGTDSICDKCLESTKEYIKTEEYGTLLKLNEKNPESHPLNINKIKVSCRTCKGTTIAKILVLDYSLKSTTPCDSCDSLGYIIKTQTPKKKQKEPIPDNPVLNQELALKINLLLDSQKDLNSTDETNPTT